MAELEKLKDLISAIEEGDLNKVKTALDAGKINGYIKSSIVNLKDKDKRTPLHIALDQPNPDFQIIELLLDDGANISYRYAGPSGKTKQRVQADNYLHIAARAGNIDAFLSICKNNIAFVTQRNNDGDNPFHEAARMGMLLPVVKKIFEHLELTANSEPKKLEAKEAGSNANIKESQKKLREVKEKLESDKGYIVEALRSKCALNKSKQTPLDYVSKTEKEDIKKAAGIKDKLICDKNFHLCLYIAGAIACTVALCMSLYFLFLVSQTFALSSMVAMASGGAACLLFKACSEIYHLHNEGPSLQDVEVMQLSGEGLSPA